MKKNSKLISVIILMLTFMTFTQAPETKASSESVNTAYDTTVNTTDKLKRAVALFVGSSQALVNNSEVQVDQTDSKVTPVIRNGRTLVPVRFISSSLGADVQWDAGTSTVSLTLDGKKASIVIGSDKMKIDNSEVILDIPAEIINNKTFIPLRQLSIALGKKVFYDRGLIILSDRDNLFNTATEKDSIDELISRVNNLPVVGSIETLKELLKKSQDNNPNVGVLKKEKALINNADMKAADSAVPQSEAQESKQLATVPSSDYSTTNIQVQGVDEADIVKTDGEYIYQVNRQRVVVAKAYPAENLEISSTLSFTDKNFSPQELYLQGQKMIVIGTTDSNVAITESSKKKVISKIMPPAYRTNTILKTIVFDITDKKNIKQLREVEVEGNYVASRKIGSSLYLVANRYMNYYNMENDTEGLTPSYRDTAVKDGFISVDFPEIRYFPGLIESNYMVIASFDLEKPDEKANISTYLGVGQNIYASEQNLYVSVNAYKVNNEKPDSTNIIAPSFENNTLIYKFSLNDAKITYLCKGEVPGRILNQFSMDENNKSFRIATTRDNIREGNNYTTQNNLYVLDELLNMTGKIENIAPGERIYSTRFIGDRGYMVTFKTVDPLFVIDLKDPASPKILGKLKIPGYSEYLHPYDENHIIGFGKDAVELPQKDWGGKDTGRSTAFYMGLKIAIFDVTDVNNPIEMFKENIGDRGTDSELLRNHKALLFSKSKNLLAFPVTLMELKDKSAGTADSNGFPEYGQFAYQGAYVYDIDLVNGFKLKGKITHLSDEDYAKAGNYGYDNDKNVERIIYINDTLYTLSNGVLKANGLVDLKERKSIVIP